MAATGVHYTVGRESSAQYNEQVAGVGASASIAPKPIDPYVTPGDPSSGLIPHVSANISGPMGSADTAVQAYNYRLCLSWDPNNQIPFAEPRNYDPAEFALFARRFASSPSMTFSDFFLYLGLPNAKMDLNNGSSLPALGTDEVGESFAYPDGGSGVRQNVEAEQTRYMKALLYYLANDPSVPQSLQATLRNLGLCRDEFTDNGGWPYQIYVREARRMIGQYVITLNDLENRTTISDSIGVGGYNIDSHPVHAFNLNGSVAYEPSPYVNPSIPQYLIPYRILTPQAAQVTNLLVSVEVSASHIAYASLRIEPTYMIMGQAAGAAASIAIGQGTSVQNVSYAALSAQLLEDGGVLSAAQLSATSLTFQPQAVGTASNSQSVYLNNISSTPLSISSMSLSGANASSFVFASTCGSSLAAGASCTINGHFAPTAMGALKAGVIIAGSALGSPLTVTLTGTGLAAPVASLSTTSLAFGTQPLDGKASPQQVTVTNIGAAPMTITRIGVAGANTSSFLVTSSCGPSLAAGASCTIQAQFAPASPGPQVATVTVSYNALGSPQSIVLSGTGVGPQVTLSTASIPFGAATVGTWSASQWVTMVNSGNAPFSISSINVTGAGESQFVFADTCGSSLAAGSNCFIHGHFAPMAAGAFTAAVTVAGNAVGSPQSIALSGSGVSPPVTLSAISLSFSSTVVGASSGSSSVTLTNTGAATLWISSIAVAGLNASSFIFANTCGASLAVGANCTIHGHFTPMAGGAMSAAVSIADNAAGSPQSIALSGRGVVPPVTLSAASLSFASTKVGASTGSQSVTLTNTGTATLSISGIAVIGASASQFVFANSCGASLAVGANCTIHGHFAPTAAGAISAGVIIADNAANSPQGIALSGTGQ